MSINLPLDDQKRMLAFVDRRHPGYHEMIEHWTFCEQTYNGGRQWFIHNIHKYIKEGGHEFRDRLNRSYRFNHTREVTSLVTKYIFKEGIIRNDDDAPQAVIDFWKQATPDGSTIDELMKRASDKSSVAGRVWMVVDNNVSEVMSQADEADGTQRIYAYMISQQDVLDFAHDQWGKLRWVLYRIPHRQDDDPINSSGDVIPRYMLWTQDEWVLLEEHHRDRPLASEPSVTLSSDSLALAVPQSQSMFTVGTGQDKREVVLIARGDNKLSPVIPVRAINHMETEEPYSPPGLVDEIAYLDRTVANYLSNLDAIIQDQTFSQLVIPGQALLPGDEGESKMLEMSTRRAFTYDGESGTPPTYISPDATQAKLIIDVIKMIIGEIYHSVGMAGERTKSDNSQGIDNSSGVAKAYDFERMNALLCAKADQLDRAENDMMRFVCLWAGEAAPDKDLVKYPESYDVRSLPDEFEIAQNLAILEAPDSLRRVQMTAVMDKMFPRMPDKIRNTIIKELKDWPVDPMEQMQATIQMQSNGEGKPMKTGIKSQTPMGGNKQGLAGPTSTSMQGQAGTATAKP